MTQKRSFLSLAVVFIAAWYLIVCSVHYVHQRPLWLDEHSVFKSVAYFQSPDFFCKKLAADQIFPRVYLFLIHKVSQPFDFDLLSVRFLPFISMLTAFFIWLRVARHELKEPWQYLTFVLSWVGSSLLVYYSAELKPYSMDVLVGALFLLFLHNQERLSRQDKATPYLLSFIALPLLGLLSYPAFMFFVFPLYNHLKMKEKKDWHGAALAGYCLSVLVALSVVYFFDMRINKANTHTQNFQDYSISFQSAGAFIESWGEGTKNLFSRWFAERPKTFRHIAVFFVSFGLIRMFTGFFRNFGGAVRQGFYSVDVIGLVLYSELFILSALGKYPFSVPRTALFFCPVILMMTIKGIADLQHIHKYLYRAVHALYLIFLLVVAVGVTRVILTQDFSFASKIW